MNKHILSALEARARVAAFLSPTPANLALHARARVRLFLGL